ncbi:MAG: Zn-dependent hydrolase [Microcystaceae cyanobacterium]
MILQSPEIAPKPRLSVNSDRLNCRIARLADIGKLPNGGVSRVAFTAEDLLARQLVQVWMREAGMTVRTDTAGNIIGTYSGKNPQIGALATGSHIDTVPVAGHFDGVLGVIGGIEVVQTLYEQNIQLNHPIEVIVFTDEECTVIGCKAMAGNVLNDPDHYRRKNGTSIESCLEKIGGDWSKVHEAHRKNGEIAAFVELHVEQGGILERENKSIGVVKGVVGQYRLSVTIKGRANHAGTTPMDMRQDALLAASQIVLAVNQLATETPGEQVATVGYMEVLPNAVNTVASQVNLAIDLRDLSQDHLDYLIQEMKHSFHAIAIKTDTDITLTPLLSVLPTLAEPDIMDTIVEVCDDMGLSYTYLPSRAGHDAQEIGRFADMGMIFVPSRQGISHSADEYTSPEQCTQGVNMLLQTFLRLDQKY